MKQNSSPMPENSYTNTSQIQVRGQKFLVLVLHKSWKYTVVVKAHDKLGHQGTPAPTA